MEHKHLETEIEHLKQAVQELKDRDKEQTDDYTQKLDALNAKMDKALDQLAMYRHFTVFIRAVLIGIIMILTLKFGDIKDFFTGETAHVLKG